MKHIQKQMQQASWQLALIAFNVSRPGNKGLIKDYKKYKVINL